MSRIMAEDDQECLIKLKNMREEVNWEVEKERRDFLPQLCPLIKYWEGELPNLHDIFRKEEIDWLLVESINIRNDYAIDEQLIEFVVRSGYKDEPEFDADGKPFLRRSTAVHSMLGRRYDKFCDKLSNLFKIYNRFDVNYTNESGITHFHVACQQHGCYDVVEKYLELGQDPNCPGPETIISPLLFALTSDMSEVAELLLRSGADPNVSRSLDGSTPLHILSMKGCGYSVVLAEILFEISNENHRSVNVDALDRSGQTPLHLALSKRSKKVVKLLLKNGADPMLADAQGMTPLHIICNRGNNRDLAEAFFEIIEEKDQTLNVNVRDNMGRTPLQLAVEHDMTDVIDVLLDYGADPNSANEWGLTSLHSICTKYCSDNWTKIFFKLNDNVLQVDSQDKKGNTPLHYALSHGNKNMTELLLKRGANPNLTNKDASTPLHFAFDAEQGCRDDLTSLFFKITDNLNLAVQVNARDSLGRTPLQYAVASLSLKIVGILLDHGADLSGFVFPDEASFTKYIGCYKCEQFQYKLELASGLLVVVEHLEKRGWELDQFNLLIIMEWFAKHKVFETSMDLEEFWYDKCASEAKIIMMNQNVSLYDIIRLRPNEAAELLTYEDCFRFARTDNDFFLRLRFTRACAAHVCKILSCRFFGRLTWTANMWLPKKRVKNMISTTKETENDSFILVLPILMLICVSIYNFVSKLYIT